MRRFVACGCRGDLLHAVEGQQVRRSRIDLRHRVAQMRHHRLEIGDERHVGARARHVVEIDSCATTSASSHSGPRVRTSPLGPASRAAPGKLLSAFASDEIDQRDVEPVLVGHVAHEPLPSRHARRSRHAVGLGPGAARRRSTGDDDQLRAVERGDRSGHRVPDVLADEDRRASPTACRTRGSRARARRSAPRRTVRRWEGTPCGARAARAEWCRPARRTSRCCTACCATPRRSRRRRPPPGRLPYARCRSAASLPGRHGMFAYAAFEEVAAQRGLGKAHELRSRLDAPPPAPGARRCGQDFPHSRPCEAETARGRG